VRDRPILLLLAFCATSSASLARAQITEEPAPPFPDPAKFSHGLYAEGEIGAVTLLGRAGDKLSPGVALGARLGYDLLRWVALQAHVLGSTHEGSFDGAPLDGQLLQVYQISAELKVTYTFRQLSLFGAGGMGAARLSSNLLAAAGLAPAGKRTFYAVGGGAGLDYHTLNRHFSVGLYAGYMDLLDLHAAGALVTTTYLRYTF
jgi:hypothetical protein